AALADGLLSSPGLVETVAGHLVDGGLVELNEGSYRLTKEADAKGHALLAAEQKKWGPRRAQAALDGFHILDQRMKDAVTAWQLREMDGAQVLNDHTDAAYDTSVLARITALHGDVAAWVSALHEAPAQLDRYLERLARALARAQGGDHRFVASPRVDSYHGVWFELHEELI